MPITYGDIVRFAGLTEKDYQRRGIEQLVHMEKRAPSGGIFADEMGLGKTFQMLAVHCVRPVRRSLIVVPPILLNQWKESIKQYTGHDVAIYHGASVKALATRLESFPLVLTTYGHVSAQKGSTGNPLHALHWDRIVFDEAHHLRNKQTNVHYGARLLRGTTRWMVTGTPVQNRLADLGAIFSVLGVDTSELTEPAMYTPLLDLYMLRRTKITAGIVLPPISVTSVNVSWRSEEERTVASALHARVPCTGVGTETDISVEGAALSLMLKARQSCIMPALVSSTIRMALDDDVPNEVAQGLIQTSKLDAVSLDIADRRADGRKLVFCTFRREIEQLRRSLHALGFTVGVIDGEQSPTVRGRTISASPDVLIIQIQTGCEGLNLQEYTEIYFVSPNWNPAVEDQAIARSYRLGQNLPVSVFIYTMESPGVDGGCSLDEHVVAVKEKKRDLANMLLCI